MFNLGGGELVVILLVALLVIGPAKLPEAARQVGRAMTEVKRVTGGFQRELRSTLDEPQRAARPSTAPSSRAETAKPAEPQSPPAIERAPGPPHTPHTPHANGGAP